MNFAGFDVSALDVEAFVRGARALYVPAALLFLLLVLRRRSPALLLLGVVLANAWAYGVSTWPLQRLYGLGPSGDRLNNLGLCQVVAAGSPAWQTAQPGQLHFEPFWGLLMALVSGFDNARLYAVYAFMPLVAVSLFALALFLSLRVAAAGGAERAWEAALAAGFATLLCASPLDHLLPYRVSWAMTFLLKPNHALGLVCLPLVLLAFARARSLLALVGVGFLLQVMGWVFVIHMGLAACGLLLYALMSLLWRTPERRRHLRDVALVLAVNLVIVSPYLYMLLVGYRFLVSRASAVIPPSSPHLLEVTFHLGWLFPLAAWGAACLWRRGDRLSQTWAAQILGALVAWAACLGLSALRLARELDEFYYWARFLVAIGAAAGAWDLGRRALAALRARGALALALRFARGDALALLAVALCALVLPATLPAWWDPPHMDSYFRGSLAPLPALLTRPMDFLRARSAPGDVVVAERAFAPWISGLAARRVLLSSRLLAPKDFAVRGAVENALVRGRAPEYVRLGYERYGVRYLVLTPSLARAYAVTFDDLRRRPDLRLIHVTQAGPQRYVAIFEIRPDAARATGPAA